MAEAIVVADGSFPVHDIPLGYLSKARMVVCCDGSTASLVNYGIEPDAIVGDMDSLSDFLRERFADRIHADGNQETNDLTKAVLWCRKSGYDDVIIIGASGKREDHSIGNISLLAEYSKEGSVKMITDSGVFIPFPKSCTIESEPGQQVSIFSINPQVDITSKGLLYKLVKRRLTNWWEGTLNEATGNQIELDFSGGPVIIFFKFME